MISVVVVKSTRLQYVEPISVILSIELFDHLSAKRLYLVFVLIDRRCHILPLVVIIATDCILAVFVVVVAGGIVKAALFKEIKSVFVEISFLLFYLFIRKLFEFLFIFVFTINIFL